MTFCQSLTELRRQAEPVSRIPKYEVYPRRGENQTQTRSGEQYRQVAVPEAVDRLDRDNIDGEYGAQ